MAIAVAAVIAMPAVAFDHGCFLREHHFGSDGLIAHGPIIVHVVVQRHTDCVHLGVQPSRRDMHPIAVDAADFDFVDIEMRVAFDGLRFGAGIGGGEGEILRHQVEIVAAHRVGRCRERKGRSGGAFWHRAHRPVSMAVAVAFLARGECRCGGDKEGGSEKSCAQAVHGDTLWKDVVISGDT